MSLKINFFSREEDFLTEAFRLEQLLSQLGRVASHRSSGIAQFTLHTELSKEEVEREVTALALKGSVSIAEEENEEMASA